MGLSFTLVFLELTLLRCSVGVGGVEKGTTYRRGVLTRAQDERQWRRLVPPGYGL